MDISWAVGALRICICHGAWISEGRVHGDSGQETGELWGMGEEHRAEVWHPDPGASLSSRGGFFLLGAGCQRFLVPFRRQKGKEALLRVRLDHFLGTEFPQGQERTFF